MQKYRSALLSKKHYLLPVEPGKVKDTANLNVWNANQFGSIVSKRTQYRRIENRRIIVLKSANHSNLSNSKRIVEEFEFFQQNLREIGRNL